MCIVCRQELFSSTTKFDAGCGWPAFNDVLDKGKVTLHKDTSISGEELCLHWECRPVSVVSILTIPRAHT